MKRANSNMHFRVRTTAPATRPANRLIGFANVFRLTAATVCAAAFLTGQENPVLNNSSDAALIEGRQTFAASCASCHGLDGRGSERAPDIADRPDVRELSLIHI